jgi:hypothetical protein
MNFLIEKHKEILIDLLNSKVDFLLVGGYAVVYHGYGRTTGDMDVWLKPDNENKMKLLSVLEKHLTDKSGIEKIKNLDFKEVIAFHIGSPPDKVDFLTKIAGVDFNEAFSHKASLSIQNQQIPVLQLNDLIKNKLLSARLQDKADVEELQKIINLKKK